MRKTETANDYYVVVCWDDGREDILATRRIFGSETGANRYASTVAADRRARVMSLVDYLINREGWRVTS